MDIYERNGKPYNRSNVNKDETTYEEESLAQLATPPNGYSSSPSSSSAAAAVAKLKAEELICEESKEDVVLLQPYKHIATLEGKQIRSHLTVAFNHWLKVPEEKLSTIMEIIEMVHNSSLLLDDIQDSNKLRKGKSVAHEIYGTPATLNCANYVYFLGLQRAHTLGHPEVTKVFTEQMIEMHKGQGMDIHWRDNFSCPTEEQYKRMVIKKTGGLLGLPIRLMKLFSEDNKNLKPLIDNLGLYFHIKDEFANLCSADYRKNKKHSEYYNIVMFTLPTMFAIRNSEYSTEISHILRQNTNNRGKKEYCIDMLRECGAFQYTVKTLKNLEQRLKQQIRLFGGNPLLWDIIDKMSLNTQ